MNEAALSGKRLHLGPAGILELGRVIHEYPGKRRILRATLEGREVIVKCYLGRWRYAHEWWRGVRGARALAAAGIPTATLYYAGYSGALRSWIAVYEWIETDEPWPPAQPHDPAQHRRLVSTVAAHHEQGIVQNDLNWRNFLPSGGALNAVDTDRVTRRRAPLGRRASLRHLARMYASKTKAAEGLVREGFRHYVDTRRWEAGEAEELMFLETVRRGRRRQALKVARRAARGWKYYVSWRLDTRTVQYDRRTLRPEELERVMRRLPDDTSAYSGSVLELGNNTVRVHVLPGGRAARRHWVRLLALARLGLPIEHPAALIRPHGRERVGKAWVVQCFGGARPLIDCVAHLDTEERRLAKGSLDTLLNKLRHYRIRPGPHAAGALGWNGIEVQVLSGTGLCFEPRHWLGHGRRWQRDVDRLKERLELEE